MLGSTRMGGQLYVTDHDQEDPVCPVNDNAPRPLPAANELATDSLCAVEARSAVRQRPHLSFRVGTSPAGRVGRRGAT
jgi:hypothetical protein